MKKRLKIAYGLWGISILSLLGVIFGSKTEDPGSLVIGCIFLSAIGFYYYKTKDKLEKKLWSSRIHREEKQKRKQIRALILHPHSIDRKNFKSEFVSERTGEIYKTDLSSCSCMSFRKDQKQGGLQNSKKHIKCTYIDTKFSKNVYCNKHGFLIK